MGVQITIVKEIPATKNVSLSSHFEYKQRIHLEKPAPVHLRARLEA